MGIISGIKVVLVLMLLAGAGGGFMYVKTLKADLEKELKRLIQWPKIQAL